jgi:protein CpxP
MPPGKWWDRPEMAKNLGLSADQRKKMDDVFQQMRVKLIDLHAALDKEDAAMEPLMQAAQLDDSRILPQIDRIAQARAELEKAEARLVLGLRHVLTVEQWEMVQSDRRPPERGRE